MRFTINSKAFTDALQTVTRVQKSKNALPILDCVLLAIKENMLTMTCSDGNNTLSSDIPVVDSDGDWGMAVQKIELMPIKSISNQPITFECSAMSNGVLVASVEYQNGKFEFSASEVEEYPMPQEIGVTSEDSQVIEMTKDMFEDALQSTKYAMCTDAEFKARIACVHFDMKDNAMVAVATDGDMMAKHTYYSIKQEQPFAVSLANQSVTVLNNVVGKADATSITMAITGNNYTITCGNYRFFSRIVEDRYPNYDSVIRASSSIVATVCLKDLRNTLGRVSQFADMYHRAVLHFSNSGLVVECIDQEFGRSAKESLACEYNSMESIAITMNSERLMTLLDNLEGNEFVDINMEDRKSAVILTPHEKKEGEDMVHLIMPMSLG